GYENSDPVDRARYFLGKLLCVRSARGIISGWITETEAYGGVEDKACHGFAGRRTPRTENLFAKGGIAYVYLCYGIHPLLNFVTGESDQPKAVLIRGVKIAEGREIVSKNRKGIREKNWSDGPGKLSQSMGIQMKDNGISLLGNRIWVEDHGIAVPLREIEVTPRIGVDYAGEWALKKWRFLWKPQNACMEMAISRRS
ncbi:MAG: DNA-3-methyladenine glycosylase, partial [Verrucomicrobiota bacterium]